MTGGRIRVSYTLGQIAPGVIDLLVDDTAPFVAPGPFHETWAIGRVADHLDVASDQVTLRSIDIVRPVLGAEK